MLAHEIPALLTHNRKDFERFEDRIALELIKPRQRLLDGDFLQDRQEMVKKYILRHL